jgi:hypothetical protein
VATKSVLGAGSLYVAPVELTAGATHDLTLVTTVPSLVTDGSFTPDGARLVLLQSGLSKYAAVYDVARPTSTAPIEITEGDQVPLPNQPQPETLAVTPDGSAVLVGSEAGNEGVDQPVWSVPLPPSDAPVATPAATAGVVVRPSEITTSEEPAGCRISDPRSCLDEPVGWLAAAAVALAALLITALAVLRRSR